MERTKLKELREESKLTQVELGEELDISTVYVRKIENGDVNAGLPTMLKYERFFGIDMRKLFPEVFYIYNDKELIEK